MDDGLQELGAIVIGFFLAILVGKLADDRGRRTIVWLLASLVVTPVITGILLYSLSNLRVKQCPQCAEMIHKDAAICKWCQTAQEVEEMTFAQRALRKA